MVEASLFRVFQGSAAADAQLLAPRGAQLPARSGAAPTDLQLRELAALEVQVKALQLQQQTPQGQPQALAGALAECLRFYARLLSPEALAWPDFLAAVFTKLAEHFAASDSALVKAAVLDVFAGSQAHVAQVNDAAKLLGNVTKPLADAALSPSSRALSLRLLGTMPSLIGEDAAIHVMIADALDSNDDIVLNAAVAAARSLLSVSKTFRGRVFAKAVASQCAITSSLLDVAVSSATEAQEAWSHCGTLLYDSLVTDTSAIVCLRTMTSLVKAYPADLAELHLQLLNHLLANDPRKVVRNFALLVSQDLVEASGFEDIGLADELAKCAFNQLREGKSPLRIKLSALLLLEKISRTTVLSSDVLPATKRLSQAVNDSRLVIAHAQILSNQGRLMITKGDSSAQTISGCADELLSFLHPTFFNKSSRGWQETLSALVRLVVTCQAQEAMTDHVIRCLVELVSLLPGNDANNGIAKSWIFMALARLPVPSSNCVSEVAPVLIREANAIKIDHDMLRLRALASVIFKWGKLDKVNGPSIVKQFQELALIDSSIFSTHADRYDVAKVAMIHGQFFQAGKLLGPIAESLDDESFGSWVIALQRICESEALVLQRSESSIESVYSITRSTTFLDAAAATSNNFEFVFQKHFVGLRRDFLHLLLQTQQIAAEVALTSAIDVTRIQIRSVNFARLAQRYVDFKLKLLGADDADLQILDEHAASCALLALAVDGFLLVEESAARRDASSLLSTLLPSCSKFYAQLESDIQSKTQRLQRLNATDGSRHATGAKVLQQLLSAVASVPFVLPRLFFRMQARVERRVRTSGQFLTFAESTSFTAKPRARSQLGVPLGTDFTCLLKGVVSCRAAWMNSSWRSSMVSIAVEVRVCVGDGQDASMTGTEAFYDQDNAASGDAVRHSILASIPLTWDSSLPALDNPENPERAYLPFELPVHVRAEHLSTKGAYHLSARLAIVDRGGARWSLAASGCRRGIIVY